MWHKSKKNQRVWHPNLCRKVFGFHPASPFPHFAPKMCAQMRELMWNPFLRGCFDEQPGASRCRETLAQKPLSTSQPLVLICLTATETKLQWAALMKGNWVCLFFLFFFYNEIKKNIKKKKVTRAFCTDLQVSYVQYHRVFMIRESRQTHLLHLSNRTHLFVIGSSLLSIPAPPCSALQLLPNHFSVQVQSVFMCCFLLNTPTASWFSAVRPCRRAQRPGMCLVPMWSAASGLLRCSYFKRFTSWGEACETRWRGFPGGDGRCKNQWSRRFQSKWTFVVETL